MALLAVVVGTLLLVPGLEAQAPTTPCEADLRVARITANTAAFSQIRERQEAARALAEAQTLLEHAQRRVAELEAALKAASAKEPAK